MLAKISLAAAFFLMVAPPLACASFGDAARLAPTTRPANQSAIGVVLAQDSQQNLGTSDNDNDNDNDNDSSDSADDDKQDSDNDQADQQNADGDVQQVPPTVFGGSDDDRGGPPQAPQNVYPVNPYQ
jgi:hypothetical protein